MSISPTFVDPLQAARPGDRLAGTVPLTHMPRVAAALYSREGDITYALELGMDECERTTLQGQMSGSLTLRCQRCLGALAWAVDTGFRLAVVNSAAEAESLAPGYEPLVRRDEPFSLVSVLEDEIILTMPSAGMHPEGVCHAPLFGSAGAAAPAPSVHRPFAVLADFKNDV